MATWPGLRGRTGLHLLVREQRLPGETVQSVTLLTEDIGGVLQSLNELFDLGGKSVLELATGSTVFAAGATYLPVPLAHLIGLAVGFHFLFVMALDVSLPVGRWGF